MSEETLEPTETVEEVVEPKVDLSTNFASLKKQEREVVQARAEMKDTIASERAKLMDELRANPMNFLEQNGISTNQIADQMLGIGTEEVDEPELDPRISKELEELKQWKADQEKAKTQSANDTAIKNYQTQAFSVVEQNTEDYELINSTPEGKKLYWNSIVAYAREYGVAPDLKSIAARVEASIYEKAKTYLATSKFKPKQTETVEQPPSQSPTISNSLVGHQSPQIHKVNGNDAVNVTSKYHQYLEEQKAKTMAKFFGDK